MKISLKIFAAFFGVFNVIPRIVCDRKGLPGFFWCNKPNNYVYHGINLHHKNCSDIFSGRVRDYTAFHRNHTVIHYENNHLFRTITIIFLVLIYENTEYNVTGEHSNVPYIVYNV